MRRLMLVLMLGLMGCGSSAPKGPTYGESLATYENEMKVLDRLKKEGTELFDMDLADIRESNKQDRVTANLEDFGELPKGTLEQRKQQRKQDAAKRKIRIGELDLEIKMQTIRVDAAKKVVDELRKSK